MCGRFALSAQTDMVEKLLPELYSSSEIKPSYNIAPTQDVSVILDESPKEISIARWGLIPFWSKDKSIGSKMINARAETLTEKPSFKQLFNKKRCLIVADGFFEWKKIDSSKRKFPYFIKMKTGEPFTFAGLWDIWKSHENNAITSTVIITTEPNEIVKPIHDRMPVIILPEEREFWLSDDIDQVSLKKFLKPYPGDAMEAYEVSLNVNNPAFNDQSIIEPV
ncbi:SOS response-associated peptidase [Bacteroidota bacterium]